jgi:ATP-dependent Clp protease ATP-binding subunit ClpA
MSNTVYFRWLTEFEKQIHCRKHIILYGNIHDEFLWRDQRQTVYNIINTTLSELGFELIVRYSPVSGFSFLEDSMRERFDRLVQNLSFSQHVQAPDNTASVPEPTANPMAAPPRSTPRNSTGQAINTRILPEIAFGNLKVVASQSAVSLAAIVDTADMLTSDSNQYSTEERNFLMLLKMSTLEAALLNESCMAGYRNSLIFVASDLSRIPQWVYKDNPLVEMVQVSSLNKEERQQFALRSLRPRDGFTGFFEGEKISIRRSHDNIPSQLEIIAEELADLTEGFHTVDLEALRMTSLRNEIPVREKKVRQLVDFYKFGRRDDPWEKISPERVSSAQEELSQSVIGQPKAVEAITSMLASARIGLSMGGGQSSAQPKGIFFFVGPTGVGKTELAKALARLLFADERALIRFDMSEYAQEHAAEKLTGAPPGFVGFEAGGQLTNRVLEQPYSILLFDEIEKATPKVMDKFLQILSDGRLTDGKGQTVYFNQTIIIFTSNIGASDLTNQHTGETIRSGIMTQTREINSISYAEVQDHFDQEVRWYFSNYIGRSELLGRLGDNIIVFDILREDFINSITRKFLHQYSEMTKDKYKFSVNFMDSVFDLILVRMREERNLVLGGRRIKSLLETLIEKPLNLWIFKNYPVIDEIAGQVLIVELSDDGAISPKIV